jgi:hypothetical protein
MNYGHRPRAFILHDSRTMALELLSGDWDFVVTSYHHVFDQQVRTEKFHKFISFTHKYGLEKARLEAHRKGWLVNRPVLSLLSDVYRDLHQPIRHLILDEAHVVKKLKGRIHSAIHKLHYRKDVDAYEHRVP